MIEYRLVRSARKTLTIEIGRAGGVTVHAPLLIPVSRIEAFLAEKEGWIRRRLAAAETFAEQSRCLLADGGAVPFLGQTLRVRLYDGRVPVRAEGELLLPRHETKDAFLEWRDAEARLLLTPMVRKWEAVTGITTASLAFGHAATRWGSMRSDGAMRLNTALVHCPQTLIDYVIVHELCHRSHPDHSPAFHAAVRGFLPCADELRSALKRMGPPLQPVEEVSLCSIS